MKTNDSLSTNPYYGAKENKGFPKIFYERRFCKRFNIDHSEYLLFVGNGFKYCTKHQRWEPVENFYTNGNHRYACKEWIRENIRDKRRQGDGT